jgi:hypothetical protein
MQTVFRGLTILPGWVLPGIPMQVHHVWEKQVQDSTAMYLPDLPPMAHPPTVRESAVMDTGITYLPLVMEDPAEAITPPAEALLRVQLLL